MSKTLIPKSFKANIDRALHNLYTEKGTTLHPMTAIPLFYRRMFRGDVFDFGVAESILRSEPTYAPLFSNFKLSFEWYFDSDANRYGWIDNNTRLSAEEVMNRRHHACYFHSSQPINVTDIQQLDTSVDMLGAFDKLTTVGRGSIADYAGVAPGYRFCYNRESDVDDSQLPAPVYGSSYNIDFHLTYLNIIRNYHINKQFPEIPYIFDGSDPEYPTKLQFKTISLEKLDKLFMFLRSCPNGVTFGYGVPNLDDFEVTTPSDLRLIYNDPTYFDVQYAPAELMSYYADAIEAFQRYLIACERPYGGLFCTQFEPDLYQNLLAKDQGLLRSTIVAHNVQGPDGLMHMNGFTIEEFRLANHLQGLYDKIFVSGGTDRDLSRTIWGIESNRDYDIPELLCVHSEIIGTNLITSTTAANGTYGGDLVENVAGSMQGNVNERRGAGRAQKFTAKTSGSLMCIVRLTPLVSYSENIERHLLERNFMDEFTPDMDRKGFEDVPLSDYCVAPSRRVVSSDIDGEGNPGFENIETHIDTSVGRQIAWLREMTSVNRVHGEFSNGGYSQDWYLRRQYKNPNSGEISISPYGQPLNYQYPFVGTAIDNPNFNLQVAFKCTAYRPVPRRFMPNLGN